ncbi:hypothetical protein [Vreelandella sp. GE22]
MSVKSLGQLTLDMVLKTGNFLGPMDKAGRRTKSTTKAMVDDFKKVGKEVAAVGLAAGAAAAGGIAALTKAGMSAIDTQTKLARSMGGTFDGLRAINIAASDSGIDGMEASLNRMNRRLGAVEMSGGPAAKTVERLNLNLREMASMDVDQRMAYIADRIRDYGGSAQESARHLQQLGFEQRGVVELFQQGGDAIRDARQEVDDYGLSVSAVDAAAIEAANDAFSRTGRLVESTRNALAVELAPIILEVANNFNEVAREAGGMQDVVQQGVDTSLMYLGRFLDAVWDIDRSIQHAGVSTRRFALQVVNAMATGAQAIMEGPVNAINRLIENINRVPGVDVGFVDQPDFVYGMRDQVDALEQSIRSAQHELEELESGTRPSERLNAFIQQAREAAAELQTSAGVGFGDGLPGDDDTGTGSGSGSASTARAAKKAADAIATQVAALERQAETLGMADDAIKLFELAQDGATDSQLAAARAALETIDAFEASEKAAADYESLLQSLRTTEERLTDQVRDRLAVLDAANVAGEEYANVAARIAAAGFEDAPSYGGLNAIVGGAFSELNRIDEAQNELQEWYATQLEMLDNYRQERADLSEQWDEQERALREEHYNELARIDQARQIAQLAAAEGLFGDLSSVTKAFAGEQSGIYKAMFAAEKAFAIASSIMSIQQGIAAAASLPFPANIPAMATVASATAGIVTTIQGTNLAGMAHDGIDSVPQTGTWLLEKGERVTTADTSAKLDATLARVESQMNRPGDGGGRGQAPIVNVDARGATDPTATAREVERAVEQVYRRVGEDFSTNGQLRQILGV